VTSTGAERYVTTIAAGTSIVLPRTLLTTESQTRWRGIEGTLLWPAGEKPRECLFLRFGEVRKPRIDPVESGIGAHLLHGHGEPLQIYVVRVKDQTKFSRIRRLARDEDGRRG
jgi:hypothetical protein